MQKEKNKTEGVRLNKYIANSGVCSRREADKLIESGKITVIGNSSMKRIPNEEYPLEKNSMKGKMMEMFFTEKDLTKIKISGEATSVYFIEETEKKDKKNKINNSKKPNSIAANFLTGDTIIVNFSKKTIDSEKIDKMDIEIIGGCEGIYYPGKLKKHVISNDK